MRQAGPGSPFRIAQSNRVTDNMSEQKRVLHYNGYLSVLTDFHPISNDENYVNRPTTNRIQSFIHQKLLARGILFRHYSYGIILFFTNSVDVDKTFLSRTRPSQNNSVVVSLEILFARAWT